MTAGLSMLRRLFIAVVCVAAGVWPAAGAAQTPLPTLTEPVTDSAGVIDAASKAELDRITRVLQATTRDAVVVVTVDTFAPYATIEEYATALFERAGIGTRNADNGILVLVAVRDRRVRIEVGYGLEEFITDGFAGDTIRTQMLPAFRNGGYGPGLVAGTTRVIMRVAEKRGVTLPEVAPAQRPESSHLGSKAMTALVALALLLLLVSNLVRSGGVSSAGGLSRSQRRGRRSTWSGWHGGSGGFGGGFGGGGGGFGGFGGGRSGGGGASGKW